MGLDACVFSTTTDNTKGDFNIKDENKLYEIAYWRKFYGLHNWMETLAKKKGFDEEFNGVFLRLSREDINKLRHDAIELTSQGNYDGIWDCSNERVTLFCALAKCYNELDEGKVLYYEGDY